MMRHVFIVLAMFALAGTAQAQPAAERALDRAIAHFQAGRVAESAAEFDNVVKLAPDYAPQLWQRGIALYYAGRYRDCRAQFESHRTVNPDDVENAAWHFLCVARAESVERARAALLPVGPDSRVPMREVYEMFRGTIGPEKVLAAAGASTGAGVLCPSVCRFVFRSDRTEGRRARSHQSCGRGPIRIGGRLHAPGCPRAPRHSSARRLGH